MQNILKKYGRFSFFTLVLCALLAGVLLTSCEKDDDDERTDRIELLSYGPMPIARGAELRFIGNNLDKVTAIILPDNIEIPASEFTKREGSLLALTVPQTAVEGLVVLKTPQGDITTKTPLGFSEPMSIDEVGPLAIKPGKELTITGDYLNLVGEVIFTDRVAVDSSLFISQSRAELKLLVPDQAQSGIIGISNGAEDPIIIYSEAELSIPLPSVDEIASTLVKPLGTMVLKGEHVGLIRTVIFSGGVETQEVTYDDDEETLTVVVPLDAKDGAFSVYPGSGIKIDVDFELEMMVPEITSITSDPIIPGSSELTIVGVDLYMVRTLSFNGEVEIESDAIIRVSDSEIKVEVPKNAPPGLIHLRTFSDKEVVSEDEVEMVAPVVDTMTPDEAPFETEVVITGSYLDLVKEVIFTGGYKAKLEKKDDFSELKFEVPLGAMAGPVQLVAFNNMVVETDPFTIEYGDVPIINTAPQHAKIGSTIVFEGERLEMLTDVIFPGDVKATTFGMKSEGLLEVKIPENTAYGFGSVVFVTTLNELGFSPEINFQRNDPIYDESLVYFNFNGEGKDSWWGNAINSGIEDNVRTSVDGTPYWRVNGMSGTGHWDGLFFRNGSDNYSTEGVDVNTWAVRFDLKTFEPFPEGNLRVRLGGDPDTHLYDFNLYAEMGITETNGWITVTLPLTGFLNGGEPISDAAIGGSEFGMVWGSGESVKVNLGIDNVRFEPIP